MTKAITPEIVSKNKLAVIVKESGLETAKAKYVLEKFQDYFDIAADWEVKARAIKVTNVNQTAEMAMAREGRLFLKEKRVAVEKARKELKEQALREGKAIDGIANVLKALIEPIEEYLEQQERFVEIQKEKKEAELRAEVEKRMEEERIAREKADTEEKERLRKENEKLRKKAEEDARKVAEERKKQEEALAKERAKREAERKKMEEETRREREKIEAEKRATEEKARKEKEKAQAKIEAERKEKERLEEMLKNQVTCPKCGHKFQLNGGKNVAK